MIRWRNRQGLPIDWADFRQLWLSEHQYPLVGRTIIEKASERTRVEVNTVWLGWEGLDDTGDVLLPYETSVIGGPHHGWSCGWPALLAAIRGHDEIVRRLEAGQPPISKRRQD